MLAGWSATDGGPVGDKPGLIVVAAETDSSILLAFLNVIVESQQETDKITPTLVPDGAAGGAFDQGSSHAEEDALVFKAIDIG